MGDIQGRAAVTDTFVTSSSHRAAVEAIGVEVGLGLPGCTLAHHRKRNAGTARHNLEGVPRVVGDNRQGTEQAVNMKQQAKDEAQTVGINRRRKNTYSVQ
ncbi:hypothetical protein V496_05286 [Pseudogymnoascus sp. VKM F-4515 (FW-2607)]|nr:hypothetical protein V496_05286 [Pseudogymnoascus sp. VKM F-4515 (FW-2607)]KFY76216.1 hypothetical protein V498_09696 [Pseudogymnoascus sp. VKM F-4517 (FW-2822)]